MSKGVTTDELAEMIRVGFEHTASKDDIARLDLRLDHIQKQLVENHERRIQVIEEELLIRKSY